MRKFRVIIVVLLVFAIGIVSWGLYGRKSLDQIKQHATLVKDEQQIIQLYRQV